MTLFDLQGKKIKNTYQYLLQINTSSKEFIDGRGNTIQSFFDNSSLIVSSQTSSMNVLSSASSSFSQTAVSASWSSNSMIIISSSIHQITTSWAINIVNRGATTLYTGSTYPITSSWTNNAIISDTASYAIFLIGSATGSVFGTSSWAISGGTQLLTGSTVPITSSWCLTSSYSLSGNSSGTSSNLPISITQSFKDFSMFESAGPDSSALNPPLNETLTGATLATTSLPSNGFISRYLMFNYSAGGISYISTAHIPTPITYKSGLTHSFKFFNVGTFPDEKPSAVNKIYWEVSLYSMTASNSPISNIFSSPILIETKHITQSLSGIIHDSGSVFSTSSLFNDPQNHINQNSIIFLNLIRLNSLDTSDPNLGGTGDSSNYTGSVGVLSNRLIWNVQ